MADPPATPQAPTPQAPMAVPAVDEQRRVERGAREAERQVTSPLSRLLDSAPARNLGLVAVLVLLGIVGVSTADTFLTRSNLLTILTSAVGDRRDHGRRHDGHHRRRHRPVGRQGDGAGVGVEHHGGHPVVRARGDGGVRAGRRRRLRAGERAADRLRPDRAVHRHAGHAHLGPGAGRADLGQAQPDRHRPDHRGHRQHPAAGHPVAGLHLRRGGGRRLGGAQPDDVRASDVRHRRQPGGGPARGPGRAPAHRGCSTSSPGSAAASPRS